MSEPQIPVLCPRCTEKLTRWSVALCAACAKNFKAIVLPNDVQTWDEVSTEASSDNGISVDAYISALLLRISNQNRELGRVNVEVEKLKVELRRAHHGARA